jgi:D-alanine transfer protein
MPASDQRTFAARFARMAAGRPHLAAALLAMAICAVVLVCGVIYARELESRYVRDLSKVKLPMWYRSVALHAAALRRQDTLLLYGSSELTIPDPYRASDVFRKYSSGFQVFPVGRAGTTSLIILQDLAAIGSAIRNKRVVVSVSPAWFYLQSSRRDYYAGNFSPLEAYALAFSGNLSRSLRRQAARRMLFDERTLRQDPVLKLSLQVLASRGPSSRALYRLVWPLGKLEELVLRLQDHWRTVRQIRDHSDLSPRLEREAGLERPTGESSALDPGRPYAAEMLSNLRHSTEWLDLELLLEGLKQLGARPLLLSMPIAGAFYDRQGVSREDRHDLYYERLRELASRHGVPLVDFEREDEDTTFLSGIGSHLSPEGWLYYDDALDRFYHGALD